MNMNIIGLKPSWPTSSLQYKNALALFMPNTERSCVYLCIGHLQHSKKAPLLQIAATLIH